MARIINLIPWGSYQYFLSTIIFFISYSANATIDISNTTPASNGCDGTVEVTAEGSAGPFSLSIDGGNPIPDINGT